MRDLSIERELEITEAIIKAEEVAEQSVPDMARSLRHLRLLWQSGLSTGPMKALEASWQVASELLGLDPDGEEVEVALGADGLLHVSRRSANRQGGFAGITLPPGASWRDFLAAEGLIRMGCVDCGKTFFYRKIRSIYCCLCTEKNMKKKINQRDEAPCVGDEFLLTLACRIVSYCGENENGKLFECVSSHGTTFTATADTIRAGHRDGDKAPPLRK